MFHLWLINHSAAKFCTHTPSSPQPKLRGDFDLHGFLAAPEFQYFGLTAGAFRFAEALELEHVGDGFVAVA